MSLEKHLKTYVVTTDGSNPTAAKNQDAELSIEDILIQPGNREEEKELYQTLYSRIYPNVKPEGDFTEVAKITSLNKRKLRQALLFRLGSGEVMQLFGLKKGSCFVCEGALAFENTKEPFCLKCLQKVEHYYASLPSRHKSRNPETQGNESETESSLCIRAGTEASELPISRDEYERLLQELNHYKKMETEDKPAQENNFIHSSVNTPEDEVTENKEFVINDIEELLAISENDAHGIDDFEKRYGISEEMQILIESSKDEPLRHYGFKRIKQRQPKN